MEELEKLRQELVELELKAQCAECFAKLPDILYQAQAVKKRIKELEDEGKVIR